MRMCQAEETAVSNADDFYRKVLATDVAQHFGRLRNKPAAVPAPGRNQPCSCGSGKKHKHCCGAPLPPPAHALSDEAFADRVKDILGTTWDEAYRHAAVNYAQSKVLTPEQAAELLLKDAQRIPPGAAFDAYGSDCYESDGGTDHRPGE